MVAGLFGQPGRLSGHDDDLATHGQWSRSGETLDAGQDKLQVAYLVGHIHLVVHIWILDSPETDRRIALSHQRITTIPIL